MHYSFIDQIIHKCLNASGENKNKKREKFFTTHSGGKWGSPEYFDLIINSANMDEDSIVAMLEGAAKA